jgi:FtsP/CotA-like multicopper oxidase with cupredoxin domain
MKHTAPFVVALSTVAFACSAALAAGGVAPAPTILANDNRVPAGTMVGHERHLSLEARWGSWYPDGPSGASVPIEAFAQSGAAPQIPGPAIRVAAGTVVVVRVSNAIAGSTLQMHGLMDRPTVRDRAFAVPYGATREVRFRASAAGTYYYWGSTTGKAAGTRAGVDSQLTGAIVVDPPGAKPDANDRILVIGQWDNVRHANGRLDFDYEVNVINGLAWPHTERLSYDVGQMVRWHVIDGAYGSHPLHLHGFYFNVDARGDGIADSIYAASDRDRRVTELVEPGHTFTMSWIPARAGNWLFHCHLSYHAMDHAPLAYMLTGGPRMTAATIDDGLHHARMGGLVLGVTVRGPKAPPVALAPPARRIGLTVETVAGSTFDAPSFRYVVHEGGATFVSPGAIGPSLVLVRGVPVAIDVTNHLDEATAVHWHGMELQNSFYDGTVGFGGTGSKRAPMIMPGEMFEARMTPSRAGTFIYHTHMDDAEQLRGGLAGALIVVPPGAPFDPATDHVFAISTQHASADEGKIFVNGESAPAPMVVKAGVRQRLRFINVTTFWTNAMLSLSSGGKPLAWTPLAVDGADLPLARRAAEPAVDTVTIGQTRDYTFVPARGQSLLQIWPAPNMPPVPILVNAI